MWVHENICNQSSHRDFQLVNLNCQLRKIQNFSKGMDLETLSQKNAAIDHFVQNFPVHRIHLTGLQCQSVIMLVV